MRELTGELSRSDCVVPLPFVELSGHRDNRQPDGHVQPPFGHLPHLQQQP